MKWENIKIKSKAIALWSILVLGVLIGICRFGSISERETDFFTLLQCPRDSVDKVTLTYEPQDVVQMIKPEHDAFERLMNFLDCHVVKEEIPLTLYSVDPIRITLTTGEKEVQLSFITVEGSDILSAKLYLMWKGKAYLLNPQEEAIRNITPHKIASKDWLWFYMYTNYGHKGRAEGIVTLKGQRLPQIFSQVSLIPPFCTREELVQKADVIIQAKLKASRVEEGHQGQAAYIRKPQTWEEWPDMRTKRVITVTDIQALKGTTEKELSFEVPGGRLEEKREFLPWGITERSLEEGKSYVFFLKETETGYSLADFSFGILEVLEDGRCLPLFNVDKPYLQDYYVTTAELVGVR